MSFNYDPSLASTLDEVRSNLGDTVEAHALLPDETIEAVLAKYSDDVLQATSECCLRIVGKLARDTTTSGAAGTQNRKEKVDRYMELYRTYKGLTGELAEPFVSGSDVDEVQTYRDDTSSVQPAFTMGQDDYAPVDPETNS